MKRLKELIENPMSKEELFRDSTFSFDYSLPQDWLNEFSLWCKTFNIPEMSYDVILSTTIWAFTEKNYYGFPVFGCLEVYEAYLSYLRNK